MCQCNKKCKQSKMQNLLLRKFKLWCVVDRRCDDDKRCFNVESWRNKVHVNVNFFVLFFHPVMFCLPSSDCCFCNLMRWIKKLPFFFFFASFSFNPWVKQFPQVLISPFICESISEQMFDNAIFSPFLLILSRF